MSIVKRHDVIQTSLLLKTANKDLAKIEDDKSAWTDFQWKERDLVLKKLHAKEVNAVRQHANLAIDHQKMLKAEFTETLTVEFGKQKASVGFKNGKGEMLTFRTGEGEGEEPSTTDDYFYPFLINPYAFAGFKALKDKYQYFKFNKISVKFVANTASNLSPIICRYMPPVPKVDNLDTFVKMDIDTSYITKFAESAGTNYGFLSIHCPPCLVKTGEYKENASKEKVFSFGETGSCMPNLCRDRLVTDYMDFNQYLDYGYFIFETRNITNYQSAVIQLHYYIDFYTGYDFEAAEYGTIFGPGGEGEGDDDKPVDQEEQTEHELPDTTPSSTTGPQPKGGMVRKSYKKSGH